MVNLYVHTMLSHILENIFKSEISFISLITYEGDFFMYAALNQKGLLEYAVMVKEPSDYYSCPICHQQVCFKISQKGKPFFAHQKACGQLEAKAMFGETDHHKVGKALLNNVHPCAKQEFWLGEIFQQVDSWVPLDKPFIFEFQHSKIPSQILKERHQAYLKVTENVYWIGDSRHWSSNKLSHWQRQLLHYNHHQGYHWYMMDLASERLRIYSKVPVLYSAKLWHCHIRKINLKNKWLSLFLERNLGDKVRFAYNQKKRTDSYLSALRLGEKYRPLMMRLRKENLSLNDIPGWIFDLHWRCLLVEQPAWYYLSIVWLFIKTRDKKRISQLELRNYLINQIELKWIILAELPLVQRDFLSDLVPATIKCFEYYRNVKVKK